MRKLILIIVLTILVFSILTISTAEILTHVDGNDTIGFPFVYQIRYGGKCSPCPPNRVTMDYLKLTADIVFSATISIILLTVFARVKNVKKIKENVT